MCTMHLREKKKCKMQLNSESEFVNHLPEWKCYGIYSPTASWGLPGLKWWKRMTESRSFRLAVCVKNSSILTYFMFVWLWIFGDLESASTVTTILEFENLSSEWIIILSQNQEYRTSINYRLATDNFLLESNRTFFFFSDPSDLRIIYERLKNSFPTLSFAALRESLGGRRSNS